MHHCLCQIYPLHHCTNCLHCLHNSQHRQLYWSELLPPPPQTEAAAAINYVNVSPLKWLSVENDNFMPTYIDSVSTTVMQLVQRTGGIGVWILTHEANVLQGENMIGRVDNTIDLTRRLQGTGGTDARLLAHVANVVERETIMAREENPIDLTLKLATPAEGANLTLDSDDKVDFLSRIGSSGPADQPNE